MKVTSADAWRADQDRVGDGSGRDRRPGAVLRRFKVPPAVSLILAWVAIGPAGLGLEDDRHKIELVADSGD